MKTEFHGKINLKPSSSGGSSVTTPPPKSLYSTPASPLPIVTIDFATSNNPNVNAINSGTPILGKLFIIINF